MRNVAYTLSLFGLVLFGLNGWGLFKTMRSPDLIQETALRFGRGDLSIGYPENMQEIRPKAEETPLEFTMRLNGVVKDGLAHIHWETNDPGKYSLRVPVWENFILFALGSLPWTRDFERYHFRNYKKTLERGIGICGDASMVISEILEIQGIDTHIVSLSGHVVAEVLVEESKDEWWVFDADFGVVVPYSTREISKNPDIIRPYYEKAGYGHRDLDALVSAYSDVAAVYEDVCAFGPRTYMVEVMSYWLKWVVPLFFIATGAIYRFRSSYPHESHQL